jgi:hypothetical protein
LFLLLTGVRYADEEGSMRIVGNIPSALAVSVQIASVLAVAIGVGLLVAGNSVEPVPLVGSVGQAVHSLERWARDAESFHELAAWLKGFGAGFLTLGILGLVVPWANALVYGRRGGAPPAAEPVKLDELRAPADRGPRQSLPGS